MKKEKILGIFYTHNNISPKILTEVLKAIELAKKFSNENQDKYIVEIVIVSWEHIENNFADKQFLAYFKHLGHMSILCQILRAVYEIPDADYICFLEHDMLYNRAYFHTVYNAFKRNNDCIGVSYENFIGINETGYLKKTQSDQPQSMISLKYEEGLDQLEYKLKRLIVVGAEAIEIDDKRKVYRIEEGIDCVHINMNKTKHSHHLTSHYNIYESKSNNWIDHPYWGDYKQYFPLELL